MGQNAGTVAVLKFHIENLQSLDVRERRMRATYDVKEVVIIFVT